MACGAVAGNHRQRDQLSARLVMRLLNVLTLPDEARQRWDRLLLTRNVPMVVGSDAHGGVHLGSRVTIFTVA